MYYSPVRHVINIQLACVKYTASVHPEQGSNSQFLQFYKIKAELLKNLIMKKL